MTLNQDFKTLIRTKMAQTGQNYTAARAELIQERAEQFAQAESLHRTVVSRFYKNGALTSFPAKRTSRAHVLLYLVNFFEPGMQYTEKEINTILQGCWDDYAYLRRELVEYGYLVRDASGQVYRLAQLAPNRWDTVLHAEAPEWEALWLPGYLAGNTEKFALSF